MLSDAQKLVLKNYILSVPEWAALPVNSDTSYVIADELKKDASPAFIVWKTSVTIDEIMRNGMAWDRVDNLTVGKARIWDWIGRLGTFNAAKPNNRACIDSALGGTCAGLAVRAVNHNQC